MAEVLASAVFRAFSLTSRASAATSNCARSSLTRARSFSSAAPSPPSFPSPPEDPFGAEVTRVYSCCSPFTCFSIACSLSFSFSYFVITPLRAPSSGMRMAQMNVSSACTSARAMRSLWYKLFSEEELSGSWAVAAVSVRMSFTLAAKRRSRTAARVPTTTFPVALPPTTRHATRAGAERSGLNTCAARLSASSASVPTSTESKLSYAMLLSLCYVYMLTLRS
mmetsp:Transcript_39967/g.71732  ORF Transcript_39967/g.71732 Transcript_39967/m.71732 type:complete len:223 (-) Transcript_39967:140-808(-)